MPAPDPNNPAQTRWWHWLFPMPQVAGWEGLVLRLCLAFVLWDLFPHEMKFHGQPAPTGLAHWFDLTWLAQPGTFEIYRVVFAVAMVLLTAGWALPLVLPAATLLHILPYTLINSQGSTNHSYQIMSLSLLGLSAVAVVFAARGRLLLRPPTAEVNGWMLLMAQTVIAGAYFISVLSKLGESDGAWLVNSHNIALDLVKTSRQNYHTWLRPELLADPPGVVWLLQHPQMARLVFDAGFVLEALMFLAIGNRRAACLVGILIVAMHHTIEITMGLTFPSHIALVTIFWILPLPLGWIQDWLASRRRG